MKNLAGLGILACGLITSALTALGVVIVHQLIGFNLFTLSVFVVLPAGALICGMGAASGYYFGSLYFHQKPKSALLWQMLVVAGLTQLLISYGEYSTLVLDDGIRASDVVGFRDYLDLSLTKAHYRVGRGAGVDTGEVGSFGYWLAVIQFVGFVAGGFLLYGILKAYPVCEPCQKYLRVLVKRENYFDTHDDLAAYYDGRYENEVPSSAFDAHLAAKHEVAKKEKGTMVVKTDLLGCPSCKTQSLRDRVEVNNGSEWKQVSELTRRVLVPEGVDLAPAMRGR